VPAELIEAARQMSQDQPALFAWVEGSEPAEVTLTVGEGRPLADWLYVAAAPFATVQDGTTFAELSAAWRSGSGRLVLDEETAAAFTALWGPPAATTAIVPPADLTTRLWAARPAQTILPFNRLTPDLKVLRLDNQSPLDRIFTLAASPLVVPITVQGESEAVGRFLAHWPGPAANYDPGRLTRVAMTGVTALARATAYQMELGGITAPGAAVGPVLTAADIAHASNEVAFAPDCPYPNPIGDPIFCSRDSYLALLQSIGIDVVELTGNHVNDWGADNLVHSIELYEAAGMATFGGGRTLAEAERPALFEHNGNRIAFIGCNPVGPAGAWATELGAGSRPCDYPALFAQIQDLRQQDYVVIATLQYWEFYHYPPTAQQQADFRAVAAAGAAAVSGSQGHHAQGFDFHAGAFLHYGLGNLFFDQMDQPGTRQSFIDTYVIYDGRLISVELFTGLIENYCCPRVMTDSERAELLQTVFQASGW
jgi:poly-gamma-glutamate synthesis protein (capsule biosynthesis protein)